jgi:penicillin amidase
VSARRWLLAAAAAAGVLALAVLVSRVASFYAGIGARAPAAQGSVRVSGVEAPVRIVRDRFGVPHVRAQSTVDAYTGLGFAHAQDRLWQLELLRRSARGTLAELFGARALPLDRMARTLGLRQAAAAEIGVLRPSTLALLEGYARGINRWMELVRERAAPVPFELSWLELEPEPWTAEDTLLLVRMRAWMFGRSLDLTLLLDRLVRELGGAAAQEFFPLPLSSPENERLGSLFELRRTARAWASIVGLRGPVGSGGFLVGGSRARRGLPLLANDPHTELRLPNLFYVAHLATPEWELAGATWPGIPAFWTGTNQTIAWGQVALHASVSDLYDESLHPERADRYDWGGRWADGERRVETIRVRGSADESLEVISTRHGPLLASLDPSRSSAQSYSLRWTGQAAHGGIESLLALHRAQDWASFRAALAELPAPAATFLYADRTGEIGTQVAGLLPIRSLESELLPVPGRSSFYDWRGFVPFEALPSQHGRDLPFLVASAHPPRTEFPEPVTFLSGPGAGERRLRQILRGAESLTLEDVVRIQTEQRSVQGPALVARLVDGLSPDDETAARIHERLVKWDGSTAADSVGAAVFHLFRRRLVERLLEGRLAPAYVEQVMTADEPLPGALLARFLERVGTDEARAHVERALEETWSWLGVNLSSNPEKWTWGRLHPLFLRHAFEELGGPLLSRLGRRLGRGPLAAPGSTDSVWAMYHRPGPPFEVSVGPALRMAIDLGDTDHAAFGLCGGQSGHPGDELYDDALDEWLAARPRPLWLHPTDLAYHERGVWELLPPG